MSHRPLSPINSALIRWLWAYLFIPAYVFLDWASYLDPFHRLNISPWNLAPAFGLLFLMEKGAGGIFTLAGSMVIADVLVRSPTSGLISVLLLNLTLAVGYRVLAEALIRIFPDDTMFSSRDNLLTWALIMVCGTYVNSMIFVNAIAIAGLLPPGGWGPAVLQMWIGDGVGILVALPLFWQVRNAAARAVFRDAVLTLETLGYVLLSAAGLWVAYVLGSEHSYRYFYVLFLPVVWAATRQGMAGAILSVALLQMGMIAAVQIQEIQEISLIEIQMQVLVLTLVGFLIGVAVDEQRRSASQLRDSMKLAAAGEMAGAIAHELNQPLTALSAYSSACRLLLQQNNQAKLAEVVGQLVIESNRASNVVRRLRNLFGSGSTSLTHFPLLEFLQSVADDFRRLDAEGLVEVRVMPPIPALNLYADRVQMEILFRNLFANARDAVRCAAVPDGRIELSAHLVNDRTLRIRVQDNGPGISSELSDRIFNPFVSSKSSGLGLGLAICREVATVHGGKLVHIPGAHGCFELELPIEHSMNTQ